jgi:hypothetical protein
VFFFVLKIQNFTRKKYNKSVTLLPCVVSHFLQNKKPYSSFIYLVFKVFKVCYPQKNIFAILANPIFSKMAKCFAKMENFSFGKNQYFLFSKNILPLWKNILLVWKNIFQNGRIFFQHGRIFSNPT